MAEVVGVVAGAIGFCSTALAIYECVQNVVGLPEAFREIGDKLPLIIDTLTKVQAEGRRADSDRRIAIFKVVESCSEKAEKLKTIFEKFNLTDSTPFDFDRYVAIIRSWGKKGRVEDLFKSILEDVKFLASNHSVNAVGEEDVKRLVSAFEQLEVVFPSAPDDRFEGERRITNVSQGNNGVQNNYLGDNHNHGAGYMNIGGI